MATAAAPTEQATAGDLPPIQNPAEDSADEDDAPKSAGKKKKKKPKKKKTKAIPPETVPVINETPDETAAWETQLAKGAKTYSLPPWILNERERPKLDILRTPACAGFTLRTPRLILRQVAVGDTTAIRRIKMEPVVQRTQLYGSPTASDIRDSFQRRYVASSIPALDRSGAWRDEWVFAITAKDAPSLKLSAGSNLRVSNRIKDAQGYLGNFALSLSTHPHGQPLRPTRGQVYSQPTFQQTAESGLEGKLFYELHPQLWGQGLASEAFGEVLRFAFEEVGCVRVSADPTTSAEASIALCNKFGMRFTREVANHYGKPQMFHEITRGEWFKLNRGLEGSAASAGTEDVKKDENGHAHDHGHNHGHEHEHGDDCAHDHDHDHTHGHGHDHDHDHSHGHGCDHDHPPPLPSSAVVDVGPGPWAGKEVCRWCTDFRTRPVITCKCGWAKYCSRECQRADWVYRGGHQAECDAK
ncbi:hypothetical protein CcaverHIS631_0208710 [Cutaneotrichosporon cavernicola]|nr:hypothetical protein CcaverHIS631_0208710 [Cutaneotrichosporon cavernicola]BEJ05056.1 hypothetical protein CcaverHIS641_0208730 [Cutaneotrichosporon cavernicola]